MSALIIPQESLQSWSLVKRMINVVRPFLEEIPLVCSKLCVSHWAVTPLQKVTSQNSGSYHSKRRKMMSLYFSCFSLSESAYRVALHKWFMVLADRMEFNYVCKVRLSLSLTLSPVGFRCGAAPVSLLQMPQLPSQAIPSW